jgi:hypothetical protein
LDRAVAELWARTRLLIWPETYRLISLDRRAADQAAALITRAPGFAALIVERDEVSLTVEQDSWRACPWAAEARAVSRPLRAITLDLDLDLGIVGYLAPAAARLAQAGVSIAPQCAYLKDHLLVAAEQLDRAVGVLERLIADGRSLEG